MINILKSVFIRSENVINYNIKQTVAVLRQCTTKTGTQLLQFEPDIFGVNITVSENKNFCDHHGDV